MSRRRRQGVFICVEGLDGSGKTTQAKRLVRALRREGFDAVYTTEPSDGKIGKLVRRFVLDREERVPIALEALLFAADRVDHLETAIKPLLEQGKVVVCDRYVYSSLAYQGAAGLDLAWIGSINRFALKPDRALFIDVDPELVLKRLKRKRTVMENAENLTKVREIYLKLVKDQNLTMIEGSGPLSEVTESVLQIVLGLLRAKG